MPEQTNALISTELLKYAIDSGFSDPGEIAFGLYAAVFFVHLTLPPSQPAAEGNPNQNLSK
jgi:hypothetical protein